uniref:6-phosphogluconate dehydrogenase NADP-binding domain-containing protein n=1 Tax=Fibrocapsa japonica TaxID=94617 RepID=A0A7S2XW24_9STRA|mmetsp:Transcript_17805/g.25974  ORF Transcript_17805/g.25974 Transcript_17805/m.25974 type:complete len:293 (+) Transcript_17805:88-966(+)|eukprot:CAMPEP_0113934312 /NCGR_PEP_ID=MMETSP1339-20121228/1641_1 /TAXON_ID=94617 /ORGANISM="Fibrocapsa japonica" /LENGTH=292 /DNA_ID=CAMNT_0000936059 /DNA_START=83 /DNA_END=961 /DNA_ORIENTATION=+ /assembly_acc=CAM_ASM_000762
MAIEGPVGFVGIGIMGRGMALNLTKAGRTLIVWNRDTTKAESFAAEFGATVAKTPKEVVESCTLTYCMLSTLEADRAVFLGEEGVISGVSDGKCIVDCATLTAEHMSEMSTLVTEKGGKFLEAPVSGSKAQAEGGVLIFLCGGDEELYNNIKEDLSAMGKADFFFGAIGGGAKMKLVVNMVMGSIMNSLAEGVALCDASGLPVDKLLEVLDLGAMSSPIIRGKGPNMLSGNHSPAFPLKHQQKDMRFAVALGDELGLSLPVAAASNENFKRARPEFGDNDFSAVYEVLKKKK